MITFQKKKKHLHFSQTTAGSFLFLDSATDLVIYIHSNLVKALWKDDKAKDIKAPIVLDFTHLKVEF